MANKYRIHNSNGNLRKLFKMASAVLACEEEQRKDEKKKREMTFLQRSNDFCTSHSGLHKRLKYS